MGMSKACMTETSGGLLYANWSTPRLCIAATVATAVIIDGTRFCIVTFRTCVCTLHALAWDSYREERGHREPRRWERPRAYLDRVFVLGRHIREPDKFAPLGRLPRAEHERSVMAAVMALLPVTLVFRSLQSRATWGHREVRIVSEQAQHPTADHPDRWGSS